MDNNDTRLRVVLQGASIPGGWCFPGSQSRAYVWPAHFYSRQIPILWWPPDFLPNSPNTAHPSAHCKALLLQHGPSLSSHPFWTTQSLAVYSTELSHFVVTWHGYCGVLWLDGGWRRGWWKNSPRAEQRDGSLVNTLYAVKERWAGQQRGSCLPWQRCWGTLHLGWSEGLWESLGFSLFW